MLETNKRIWSLGFWSFCFCLSAIAQDVPALSFSFEKTPLIEALQVLEKEYQLTFAFDDALIRGIVIEQVESEDQPLLIALQRLLAPLELKAKILTDQYILIEKGTPLPPPPFPVLTGLVLDSLTREALSFTNVQLIGTTKGATTDLEGFFRLQTQFAANDSLLFSFVGYQKVQLPARLFHQQKAAIVYLAPDQMLIPDILIEDRAIEVLQSAASGTGIQFRPDQMDVLPGWGDNDLLRMAQLLPGVHSTDESASGLHIRGGTPDQNLILWDDIPVYHIGHFFGLFSAFNPHIAGTMEVYRSGAGVRYGGHTAGVIDISSKPDQLDSLEVTAGSNMISAHAGLTIPFWQGKSTLMIAGRRSFTDLIQSPTYQELFSTITSGGRIQENFDAASSVEQLDFVFEPRLFFSDINAKWLFRPGKGTTLSLSFFRGNDALDYNFAVDEIGFFFNSMDAIRLSNWGLSASWQQQWKPNFSTHLKWLTSRYRSNYGYVLSLDRTKAYQYRFEQLNTMNWQGLQWQGDWQLGNEQALHIGVDYREREVGFDWQYEAVEENQQVLDQRQINGQSISSYLDFDLVNKDQVAIDFGLRYTYYVPFTLGYWEPRISLDVQPFSFPLHFRGSAGRYFQFVSQMLNSNELGLGEELWILASEKEGIPFIQSTEWTAGLWFEKRGWLLELDYYQKRPRNLTTLNIRFSDGNNPYALGEGNIQGLDFLLKKKWKTYSTWLSYSYGKVTYQFDGINDDQPFPAAHDQRHTLQWTHLLQFRNWGCSVNWHIASGRPYTRAIGFEEMIDPNTQQSNIVIQYEGRNQSRLPTYHRLDLSGHYTFTLPKNGKGKVGLSIFNLYNRNNIFDREYLLVETQVGGISDPVVQLLNYDWQLLAITPNIFFELEW